MARLSERQSGPMEARQLIPRIRERLDGNGLASNWGVQTDQGGVKGSAVLFLLTMGAAEDGGPMEPCLLLNKRSEKVLQPGDLCCPGGGVEPMDRLISHMMNLPTSPLRKWAGWKLWRKDCPEKARGLGLLMTTALRECWEEMRLNPFKVDFMGPLPVQKLVLFNREIYPLVGWTTQKKALVPNWEVERIVYIPLRRLMDPNAYARYRLSFHTPHGARRRKEDFPCFIHQSRHDRDILWGATFRITMDFLKRVFGFRLPDLDGSPVIKRELNEQYLTGSRAHSPKGPAKELKEDF